MSRRTFCTFNPKENKFNTERYACHTVEEVDQIIDSASSAYSVISSKSNHEINNLLCLIKENLRSIKGKISTVYCKESGLTKERFDTEFKRTIFQLELFSKHVIAPEYISLSLIHI